LTPDLAKADAVKATKMHTSDSRVHVAYARVAVAVSRNEFPPNPKPANAAVAPAIGEKGSDRENESTSPRRAPAASHATVCHKTE
jgi:hypothetical protein